MKRKVYNYVSALTGEYISIAHRNDFNFKLLRTESDSLRWKSFLTEN